MIIYFICFIFIFVKCWWLMLFVFMVVWEHFVRLVVVMMVVVSWGFVGGKIMWVDCCCC